MKDAFDLDQVRTNAQSDLMIEWVEWKIGIVVRVYLGKGEIECTKKVIGNVDRAIEYEKDILIRWVDRIDKSPMMNTRGKSLAPAPRHHPCSFRSKRPHPSH